MNNTIGYYIEKYIGIVLGSVIGLCLYFHWFEGSVLLKEKYYDLVIKLSVSIFGFLLTILALIVNSSSPAVTTMRESKDYPRLIEYNRAAVFLCFLIIIFSVIMYLIISPDAGTNDFKGRFGSNSLKTLICIHSILCVWSAVDSAIFVRIFYIIIIFGTRKKKN